MIHYKTRNPRSKRRTNAGPRLTCWTSEQTTERRRQNVVRRWYLMRGGRRLSWLASAPWRADENAAIDCNGGDNGDPVWPHFRYRFIIAIGLRFEWLWQVWVFIKQDKLRCLFWRVCVVIWMRENFGYIRKHIVKTDWMCVGHAAKRSQTTFAFSIDDHYNVSFISY